jgi:hypothetical protein
MKKLLLIASVGLCVFTSIIAASKPHIETKNEAAKPGTVLTGTDNSPEINYWVDSLYSGMNLSEAGLTRSAFFDACKGYEYLIAHNKIQKPGILTICDYSQRSDKKRLYVLDLNAGKLLFNTYVSHGRNSGKDYATSFSNKENSLKSSLGFLVTAETYTGEHGYSLRLDGIEKGFNDNVRNRAIVVHGSDYVGNDRALNGIMMGRSFGCPAVPAALAKQIVNCIKGGTCIFNYYPDKRYAENSKILNANFVWPVAQTMQLAYLRIPDSLKLMDSGISLN